MEFATLDIIIGSIVLLSAVIGLVRGLVKEVMSLVSWGMAFVLGMIFSPQLATQLPQDWGGEPVRLVIAFILIFIGTLIVAGVLQWLLGHLINTTGLSGTDRLLGVIFGGARGLLVAIVVLMGLRQVAQDAEWWQASVLQPELLAFEGEVRDLFGQARQLFNESTTQVRGR